MLMESVGALTLADFHLVLILFPKNLSDNVLHESTSLNNTIAQESVCRSESHSTKEDYK